MRDLFGPNVIQEVQVPEYRKQKEQQREHVLALRYPGGRFHVYRMHRKDHGRQKGAGYRKPPENHPNQQRFGEMQNQVGGVVARRVGVP